MRAADKIKYDQQAQTNHDRLCQIASDYMLSEDGCRRIARLWFEGPNGIHYGDPNIDFGSACNLEGSEWEYPIVREDSPPQFGLKGFVDVSAEFSLVPDGKTERVYRLFVECKPRVNVGESIRQLRFYRHHYAQPCVLVCATFQHLEDAYVDAFLSADIDVWTFVEEEAGWRVWTY